MHIRYDGAVPSAPPQTRRERLRAQAFKDIRRHGYAQIEAGGPTALSLNGIAKAMGMSGPAMYRYFASRDELLATLVTESYEDLAEALVGAEEGARRRQPVARLRAALNAYRDWAVGSPHRYRLVFGSTYGSGALDPERVIPAAQRSMAVILRALSALEHVNEPVTDSTLRSQLVAWGRAGDDEFEPGVLKLGLMAWTRMHGIVGLEIDGFFDQVGVDPGRLYDAEIDRLISGR